MNVDVPRAELAPQLPRTLVHVEALVGYGWERCTRREREARNFTSPFAAARWIANLAKLPSHHRLVGVWRCEAPEWTALDLDELPEVELSERSQ